MRIVLLVSLALAAGCGGADEPAAREADRICAAAQPALDRAGDRVVTAADAYRSSPSDDALKEMRAGLIEADKVMARAFEELRALKPRGEDRGFEAFLSAWGGQIGAEQFLGSQTAPDESAIAVVLDGTRIGEKRMAERAAAVGATNCDAPLQRVVEAGRI
jgi:hypothetical protein